MFYKNLKTKRLPNGKFENPINLTLVCYGIKPNIISGKFTKFEEIQISTLIAYICELESDHIFQVDDWDKDAIQFYKKPKEGPLKDLGPSIAAFSFRDVIPHKNGLYIIENDRDRKILYRSMKIRNILK